MVFQGSTVSSKNISYGEHLMSITISWCRLIRLKYIEKNFHHQEYHGPHLQFVGIRSTGLGMRALSRVPFSSVGCENW